MINIRYLCVILIILFASCEVNTEGPDWEPNYYGPIAKSTVTMEDISELEDLNFNRNVLALSLNTDFEGELPSVPEFSVASVGPYPFKITDNFKEVDADTLIFLIKFKNTYPIDIAQGTVLAFRNSTDNSLIFKQVIDRDIKPGEEVEYTNEVHDKRIDADINFYLENFKSNGSKDPVRFELGNEVRFEFQLIFIKINSVVIETGKSYTSQDINKFHYHQNDTNNIVEGKLITYFDNRFPFDFNVQLYLLEKGTGDVSDSIFEKKVLVKSAPVNSNGEVLGVKTSKFEIPIDQRMVKTMLDADHFKSYFHVNTTNKDVSGNALDVLRITVGDQSNMFIQIVGDVKVNVN